MGYPVDEIKFKNFMTRLECKLSQNGSGGKGEYLVETPLFRLI